MESRSTTDATVASPKTASSTDRETVDPASASREDLEEEVRTLRSRIARLEADQDDPASWLERNGPALAGVGTALGAAAGYAIAKALTPAPPPPLSERARREIQRLLDQTVGIASETGRTVSRRAAEMGTQAREQAQETGRRLAQETGRRFAEGAENAREATRKQADAWRKQASDELAEAEAAVEQRARETAEAVRASAPSDGRTIGQTVGGVLLLATGSYLAAKARDWL